MRVGTTVLNDVPGQKAPVAMHFEIVTRCAGSGMINVKEGKEKKMVERTAHASIYQPDGCLFLAILGSRLYYLSRVNVPRSFV